MVARVSRHVLLAGALLAAAGVALGAFGAHALKATMQPAALGRWETAVQYQMWHAVALVAIGANGAARFGAAPALLGAGIVLFSGSLYLMALTELRWFGAVTPIGGMLLIAGWGLIAWSALGTGRQE
jgi:uncharacterized membrane protein YgdD (TMEM256/DUF423 family)